MKFVARIRSFFLKKDGGKEVIDKKRFWVAVVAVVGVGVFTIIYSEAGGDSSVVVNATAPIKAGSFETAQASLPVSQKVSGLLQASEQRVLASKPRQTKPAPKRNLKIQYKAPQVIERKGVDSFTSKLPIGSNLIGKLLTAVDTRETEQLYKVLLPYGGKGIPKNTILFGTITYPNKGRKVFMQFSKALLPDGKEVELKAQVLSAKDYSPGLVGKLHSGAVARVASTLGLTMVSAFTDTLTEKQVLGSEGQVTPKATTKNALYQGIAKSSEVEAQRQMAELGNVQEYVTIPAGQELIVNLLSTYRGGARKRQTSLMSGANDE